MGQGERPKRMKGGLVVLVAGLSALSIPTLVSAQSPMGLPPSSMAAGQEGSAPGSQLPTYVPSEIATSSSVAPDDRRSGGRQRNRLATPARTGRTSVERTLHIPSLCFDPGVGWIKTPAASFAPGHDTSVQPLETDKTGANSFPGGQREFSSSDRSSRGSECSPLPQTASGGSDSDNARDLSDFVMDYPILLEGPGITQFDGIETPLLAASSLGGRNLASANPTLPVPDDFNSGAAVEAFKALKRRNYVSPLKLRRLIRNVESPGIGLELRQMNSEAEKRTAQRAAEDQNGGHRNQIAAENKRAGPRHLAARKAGSRGEGVVTKYKLHSRLER